MGIFIFFFSIILLLLLGVVLYINGGNLSLSGADFFARGKELGFSNKEIKVFKKAADVLKLDKPITIMGSIEQIDRAILNLSRKLESNGYNDALQLELLEDLYSYKKKIEIRKVDSRYAISSSREIDNGQRVKIIIGNSHGPYQGVVIDNKSEHLVIDFSKDSGLSGKQVYDGIANIYFWKKSDAGYFFEGKIKDGTISKRWKITHSNSLIRNQKRQEIRMNVDIPGCVYRLIDISTRNHKSEGFSGVFVQVKNISEGGAAFLINGKMDKGAPLKLEFKLLDKHIVVCGILKDLDYDRKLNCSLLRVKFIEPDPNMLSIIRSFIYNINNERDLVKDENISKSVENQKTINNNSSSDDTHSEDIPEVEYLPEDCEVIS